MRPVQKTLEDFDKIDRYAELLHSPEVAKALCEAKQTLISMYEDGKITYKTGGGKAGTGGVVRPNGYKEDNTPFVLSTGEYTMYIQQKVPRPKYTRNRTT